MDIKAFLSDWLELSNSYDTEKYLEKYLKDAILDDPSAGEKFIGHNGIREYYTRYFIGYKMQTRLIKLDIKKNKAHMKVDFKGEFPGGDMYGTFDFIFKDEKIAKMKTDLLYH